MSSFGIKLTTGGGGGGAGTVTSVSVVTANGVSGSVATATTTPAITLTLGAITPTTVNGNTITSGTGTLTLGAGSSLVTSATNSITLTSTGATNVTLPTTGTLATLTGTEVFTNKTIGNTNTATFKDTLFTLQDDGDATKLLAFQLSGITTGNTRTMTVPDFSGTLATLAGTEALTNKTVNKITITAPATSATLTIADGTTLTVASSGTVSSNTQISVINFVFDGGGAVITTGVGGNVRIPFGCTITEATLLADVSGSIVVDIWKDTLANYPPTVADTITASAKPTLSSATNSTDTTLTGWTTSVTAGDILRFNVDSSTTVTRVTLMLKLIKT